MSAAAAEAVRDAWAAHGADGAVLDELDAYTGAGFDARAAEGMAFPLADEPFAETWRGYAAEAAARGAWAVLRERLVQLRFPVAAGTSARPEYLAATRRGHPAPAGEGLRLADPGSLRLWMHPTPAGCIPVLLLPDRGDFESVVRALARRNEPEPVPPSMGACIVSGYNNWDRVRALRAAWEAANPGAGEAEWQAEFRAVVPRKELYQDRLVLLSAGPYSAVPAAAVGLEPEAWLERSFVIRLEHECAHYFTRRVLGSMRNSLHDELLADFAGIAAAAGRFRADWFLRFMGLERPPAVREGGRLANYRGTPPLGERAFALLAAVVARAAAALESAAERLAFDTPAARASALLAIASTPLPVLALEG